jgi:predicted ABC-type transport system involved in lysophospholipase L1 biosynthesis ATPase subunit
MDLVSRRAARGRAYVIITHRLELAAAAHRHLRLSPLGFEGVNR